MKKFYAILLVIFMASGLKAQLPDGSIAPDFEITDINGNTHRLFDILNEGKTVVLDIFATWCGPCWSYHTQHVLEDFYQAHGPNGDNTAYVIAIEGDGSTNMDCIFGNEGCNDFSIGDWTDGISYPIADATSVANAYSISYYPTIYMIHPTREVNEIGQLSAGELEIALSTRPSLSAGINPAVTRFTGFNGSVCNDLWVTAPSYLVNNLGEETITDADLTISKNGEVIYEETFSGEATPYAVITSIQLPTQIIMENTVFQFELSNINGDPNETLYHHAHVTVETDNQINVSATTGDDAVAGANYFVITAPNGDFIAVENLNENNKTYNFNYSLDEMGCYSFFIYDNGGDGMKGDVLVTDNAGHVIFENTGFGAEANNDFNVASILSSTEDPFENISFAMFPNPAIEVLNINTDLKLDGNIDIFLNSVSGQKIQVPYRADNGFIQVELNDLQSGVYLINIATDEGILSRKFLKK